MTRLERSVTKMSQTGAALNGNLSKKMSKKMSKKLRQLLNTTFDNAFEAHSKAMRSDAEVAKHNSCVLRKLEKAFAENPNVDLLSKIPNNYSESLENLRHESPMEQGWYTSVLTYPDFTHINVDDLEQDFPPSKRVRTTSNTMTPDGAEACPEHLRQLHGSDAVIVQAPLAEAVTSLLYEGSDISPCNFIETLGHSENLFRRTASAGRTILKLNEDVVVKIVPQPKYTREYTTLLYLEEHCPEIPAPKPLGMIQINSQVLMFMSFVPGETLETVWPSLDQDQKHALSAELDLSFSMLRSLQRPEGHPWGGVGGERCVDHRRNVRESAQPVFGPDDFEDFVFSNPDYGSAVWIKFLRRLYDLPVTQPWQTAPDPCVLTHGDVRLANITMRRKMDGDFTISGIIDWEYSGFYPAYWEAAKVTNFMGPHEDSDWYLNLPPSISPLTYPTRWLVDRMWDKHVI